MSDVKNNRNKLVSFLCSAAIAAVSLATVFIAVGSANRTAVNNTLVNNIETAVSAVNRFEVFLERENFIFNNELYTQANLAANVITDKNSDEEVENLAKLMSLDSVIVTDTEGKSVAAYPTDLKGMNIKDNENTRKFYKVLKGFSYKMQSEPVAVDEAASIYSVSTCVGRPDGQGIVIISTTEDYSMLQGSEISNSCNDNTIIASGDKIVSSSFTQTDKTTLKELGITEDKLKAENFTLTVNNTEYICKAENTDNFTVISLVSSENTGVNAETILLITLAADIIALAVVAVMIIILDKKNEA